MDDEVSRTRVYRVARTPRGSYDDDERDFAEAPLRVLIDFNFMQYSVTVVTCRATSSKFKPPHLRRMQGVKGPHQNSTSLVVDFYVLQFKDPLVRVPRKNSETREFYVSEFKASRESVIEPRRRGGDANGVYSLELKDLIDFCPFLQFRVVRSLFLNPRKICI